MKNKRMKLIGIVTVVIVAIIVSIVLIFNQVQTNRNVLDKNSMQAMVYNELTDTSADISNCEYIKFSSYFANDLDNDGFEEKYDGTCNSIKDSQTLYFDIDVREGRLENGVISINGKNFKLATSLARDEMFKNDYLGNDITKLELNSLEAGVSRNFNGSIVANIGNDISNYSNGSNTVTLTGTWTDGSSSIEINKTINLKVDWYGETKTEVDTKVETIHNIEEAIGTDGLTLTFEVGFKEIAEELLIQNQVTEVEIPNLNGYEPISVVSTSQNCEYNYDEERKVLHIERKATLNGNVIENSVARTNTYRVQVKYPLEAYETYGADTISLTFPTVGTYYGYNNGAEEFAEQNPYVSSVKRSITHAWREEVSEETTFDVFIGNYVYVPETRENKYVISKEMPLNIYNRVGQDTTKDDEYIVQWRGYTGKLAEGQNGIYMAAPQMDRFKNVAGQYYNMEQYAHTKGIYFTNLDGLLEEDGWICVYDNISGELIYTFTKEDWGEYSSTNPYMFDRPVHAIRVETSKARDNAYLYVYQVKEINDDKITTDYTKARYDNINSIYSNVNGGYINGNNKVEVKADEKVASYEAPVSVVDFSIDKEEISNQKAEKVVMTIDAYARNFNESKWKNGKYVVELPEEILSAKINRVISNNSDVEITASEVYEISGRQYIKIYTKNEMTTTFKLEIEAELVADGRKATTDKVIKLYAVNENCNNYRESSRNLDAVDINGNGNYGEYVLYKEKGIKIVLPNALTTTQSLSNYAVNATEVVAPKVVTLDRANTEREAKVNINIANNYDGIISDVKVIGKVPFIDNAYQISGDKLGSTFSTAMNQGGIILPAKVSGVAKVYYSTNSNVTEDINNVANNWKEAKDVADWSQIKSYVIDLSGYSMQVGENLVFSYDVVIPANINNNEITYATHGVYYALETEEGKIKQEVDAQKLGIKIANVFELDLTKFKAGTSTKVAGSTYRITDGSEVRTGITNRDGMAVIPGLYVGKEYTLKEIETPDSYVANEGEIKFKVTEDASGNLRVNVISGNLRNAATITNVDGKTVVNMNVETTVRYDVKITKKDSETNAILPSNKFRIMGGIYGEVGRIFVTDVNGELVIPDLVPGVEYKLRETKSGGHYLDLIDTTFTITRNASGNIVITSNKDSFKNAKVIDGDDVGKTLIEVTITSEPVQLYNLNIVTKSEEDELIKGAQYKLTSIDTEEEIYGISDENGNLVFNGLYQYIEDKEITGEYILQQLTAGEGQVPNKTEIRFKAKKTDGNLSIEIIEGAGVADSTSSTETDVTFNYVNLKTFFLKKTGEEGKLLPGAKFKVTDLNNRAVVDVTGKRVGELVTDENGTFDVRLPQGLYKFVEIEAPEGYVLPEEEEDRTYYVGIGESKDAVIDYIVKWSKSITGSGHSNVYDVKYTDDGGYIVAGSFTGEIDFNADGVVDETAETYRDAFVAKFTAKAEYEWHYTYNNGLDGSDEFVAIDIATDGGYILGGIEWDNNNGDNALLLKIDSSGNFVWKKVFESNLDDEISDVEVLTNGDIVIVGRFFGDSINLGGEDFTKSTDFYDGFVAVYTADCDYKWAKHFANITDSSDYESDVHGTGIPTVNPTAIAETKDGFAIAVNVIGTMELEGNKVKGPLYSYNLHNRIYKEYDRKAVIISYSNTGTCNWYTHTNLHKIDYITDLTTDADDNIIAVGKYDTRLGPNDANGNRALTEYRYMMTKLDNMGKYLSNYPKEIDKDTKGHNISYHGYDQYDHEYTYVLPAQDGGLLIGGFMKHSTGNEDLYDATIFKYSVDGKVEWTKYLGGIDLESIEGIVETDEGVIAIGNFNSTTFNADGQEGALTCQGYTDTFMVCIDDVVTEPEVPQRQYLEVQNELKTFDVTTEIGVNHSGQKVGGSTNGTPTEEANKRLVEQVKYGYNGANDIIITPDEGYSVYSIEVNDKKYKFVPNEDGTVTIPAFEDVKEDINIKIVFETGVSGVLVHHYLRDEDGNNTTTKLAEDEYIVGFVGDRYYTNARSDIKGYQVAKKNGRYEFPANKNGVITEETTVVTYYYIDAPFTLTVHHYLEGTETRLVSDEVYEKEKSEQYMTAPNGGLLARYELCNNLTTVRPNTAGTSGYMNSDVVVTYYYRLKEYDIRTSVNRVAVRKFNEITNKYEMVTIKGGTISGEGQNPYEVVTNGSSSKKELKITPDNGYMINKVTINGTEQRFNAAADGSLTLSNFTNVTEDKNIVVEFIPISGTVNVAHYIKGTTTPVPLANGETAQSESKKGYVGDPYATKPVEGLSGNYELVLTPENSSGKYIDGNIDVVYFYDLKDTSVLVHHYKLGTTEEVAPDQVISGKVDSTYTTSVSSEVPEYYEKVSDSGNTQGTMSVNQIVVTYYYRLRKYPYTINCYDVADRTTPIATATGAETTYGTMIDTEAQRLDVPGYNFSSAEKEFITIDVDNNIVNLYYTKRTDLRLTINYFEKDASGNTTPIMENGKAKVKVVDRQEFKKVAKATDYAERISGFVYDSCDKDTLEIGVNNDENVINLYYTRVTGKSYTVRYVEKDNPENEIHNPFVEGNHTFGDVIVIGSKEVISIPGYNYDSRSSDRITISENDEENIVTLYYTRRTDISYTINYFDVDTREVIDTADTVTKQTFGSVIQAADVVKEIDGYQYQNAAPVTITLGVNNDENVINLYYLKVTGLEYTVRYVEKGNTSNVLHEEKHNNEQEYGNVIYAEDEAKLVNISGYDYDSASRDVITIGTDASKNVMTLYYTKRVDLSYTVNYLEKDTDVVLSEPTVVNGRKYLSEVTASAIEIAGYDKVEPTEKTITIGVENNVINFYYTKRVDLSYTVNYLEKDTNKVLAEAKTVSGKTFKESITESAIEIAGYNKVEPNEVTISIEVSNNVINFYYTKRVDLSYTVNYLEKDTENVLAPAKEVFNQKYENSVKESAIEIAGYDKVEPVEQSITIDVDGNVINFYYTKKVDLSYTVNYLEKDTNKVLAEAKTVGNKTFKESITESAIEIAGYNKVAPSEVTITIEDRNNTINFYYTKKTDLSYTVHYYEENTTNAVAEEKVVTGKTFKEVVTEEAIDVAGYNKLNPITKDLVIEAEGNEINFYYAKRNDLSYTVKYYEAGTTTEVADSKTVDGQTFNSKVEEKAIEVTGYNALDPTKVTITISANDEENVIIFYYSKDNELVYTVNYYEEGTTEKIIDSKIVTGQTYGDKVTEGAVEIPGWYKLAPTEKTITIKEKDNVINFYYSRREDLSYTVNYYEENTAISVAPSKTVDGNTFEEVVTEKAITVEGYRQVGVTTKSITIGVEENEINFYYAKREDLSYTVNYLEKNTDRVLATAKTVSGKTFNESVTESAKDIAGYDKVEPSSKTISIQVSGNIINFYYTKREDLGYKVNYLERGTNTVLADQKVVTGQRFEETVTENAIDIVGYDKVNPTTQKITIGVDEQEINFYYTKRSDLSYTVNYKEQDTETVLAPAKTVNGQTYKIDVTETAIDIAGYDKVAPTSKTITIEVSGNEITFYYTKRNDLSYVVNYLEKDTNIVVAEAKTVGGKTFGSTVRETAIDVSGYDKVNPTSQDLVIKADGNVINFYYTKREDLSYIVNYWEKGTTNKLGSKTVTGQKYKAEVTERAPSFVGFVLEGEAAQTIIIEVEDNVINFYYNRRNDLSYVVNHYEKGTIKKVAESETITGQVFGAEIDSNKHVISKITGFNYDNCKPEKLIISVNEEQNIINIYYARVTGRSYTVRYVEKGNEANVLVPEKTVGGQTYGDEIVAEDEVISIPGYNYDSSSVAKINISENNDDNVITLYYTRKTDLSYKVNYLFDNGNEDIVLDSKEVEGQRFGASVTETAIDIAGYVKPEVDTQTITIGVNENVINFYYTRRKDLSYVVKYLEEGTTTEIAAEKIVNGQTYGAVVTENAIEIPGYDKQEPTSSKITIGVEDNVIRFYYTKRKDLSYTVKYMEEGTTTEIAQSKVVNGQTYLSEVTETAKEIDGYVKPEVDTQTITIGVSGNVINFYYTKRNDLSYTVNYLEKDTNNVIHEAKTVGGKTLDEIIRLSDEVITIDGYNFVSADKETLRITTSENVINIYYTKRNDLSYIVNYLEKDTNTVLKVQKVVRNVVFDTEVKIANEKIEILGYVFDSASPESFRVGTDISSNVMNIYYTRRNDLSYRVNYLDVEKRDVLHDAKVEGNQVLGTRINASDEIIDIDGYEFESVDKNSIVITTSENIINIYYAKRNDLSYTMNFIDKDTEEVISESKTVKGQRFGAIVSSNNKAIEIAGYEFNSVDKKTITIGTGVNEFNFYYTKRNDLSYTVNYLEKDTNKVLAEAKTVGNKTFKEEVTETAIEIEGYNKVEPTSKTITIEVSGNEINFYYTKRNDLSYTVNFYEVGTKDKIAESETIENVVFETIVDSKKHAKAIEGYNFGHCEPATLTVGVNNVENVIDIYYSRVDGLTYTVNYIEKGNEENVLHPAKVQDGQTFGDVVISADEVISIEGYNYDSVSAESIVIGTDAKANAITIYYTRRNDLSYVVNYLEQGTNQVLAAAKVVDKQVLGAEAIEEAIEISGYVKPEISIQKINIEVSDNVINFYYTKRTDLSYVVNYYEEGTTQKVAESKIVEKQTYKATVKEEAIEVSGYVAVEPISQTIEIKVEGNEINFYYTRRNDLSYVVNYLEKDTEKKIIPSKSVNGQTYLSDVTEQAMPVDGYVAVEPTSKTITIQVEGNEINFYYVKRTDLSYTVNYLEQGTNEVLAAAKVVDNQTFEANVTEEAIDIIGYNKVEPERQSIVIAVENNVINFYYTKRTDLSYTVNYLEMNTNAVIAPAKVVGKQTYKASVTEHAIEIDGYDKLDPTEKSIVIEVSENVINFYYTKKDDLNYKVNYLEKDTNKVIKEQKVATGRTFDEIIIAENEIVAIDGYNYDSTDKVSITIGTGENVINIYYTKRSDLRYTVNYLEKGTDNILKAQKVVTNVVFDTEVIVDNEKIVIDGYVFDSASPESFRVGTNLEGNVMNIYYTKRNDLSYKVNYLETETNKVLNPAKVVTGKVFGEEVSADSEIIDIEGYNFDTLTPNELVIGTGENVINIYYTKRNDLSYTINFLEKDTNEVLHEPTVVKNQVFGAIVSSNGKAIAIDGYNYDSADKRTITIGTNEEENVFNLYYTKYTDLKYRVDFIERETGNTLAESVTESNRAYGEVIKTDTVVIAIDGYSFDGCDKEELVIGTGENVITVYYTKVQGLSYTVKYVDKITGETIRAPKTEGDQTFGDTIFARNERIDIDGYVYDSCSRDRLPITTGVNELTLYYIKRDDLSYKVNYIEKGTGKEIKNAKIVKDKMFKEEVYAEDEVIDINGYNFDSYDKEKITIGTKEDENVIHLYYTRRTDLGYVVNYLEKGTNKVITGQKTVENMTYGTEVFSINDVITIYGYNYDSADKESIIIGTGENVINLYFTKKDTKVTVHFYEEGTTTKVSGDVTIEGKVFDRYETEAARDVASKYELIGTPENSTGKMTEEEIVVTYYYRKKATKVIVHFYEEGTNNKLSENVVIEGRVDDRYTTTAATDVPAKYELSVTPDNSTGNMTEEIIEVTYFYRVKDTVLNIRYLEQGTNIELASPEKQTGKVEEDYITDAKVIEGYTLVGDSGNTTGKLTIAPITVTFYYLQNTSVEVNHIDKNTGDVLEKVTVDGLVGDKYTANAKNIENYVLVERPRVETVTMGKDKITLNYYYVHVSAGVIEKHVDLITGDILYNATHEGNEGDAYDIREKTFEGYDLVREKLPANARGTMTINPIEVTYYYKYRSTVIAEYIDAITNKKLASDVTINGHETDNYVTERKEFNGYKLVEVPANSEGKMTKEPIKVTYRYVHESAGVEVKHININTGKELVKSELIEGYEADEYKAEPKNIPGYDLVKEKLPANAEGKMTIDKIIVEYYYIKQSSVTVKYVDKITGEEIEEAEEINGHEGDKYETEAKEIDGYDLVEMPENAEGTMGANPSEVIYEYHRPAKVIVNYIDVDTNEEIVEPDVIEGHEDDPYETEAKEIKYYTLVKDKLPKNSKGKMKVIVTKNIVDDTTIVNYYYKKMEFSIKVDKIIDKVVLNGQTLSINGDIGKIEINKKELANAKLQIIYKIRVTNNGELSGTAKLLEKLPAGTTMSSANNPLWEISGTTATMTTEEIKPKEMKEYTVILDWTNSENNVGNKENTVDVLGTENEAGFPDGKVDLENNNAELVISISTGTSTYMIATGVAMVVLAGISIVLVKKTKEE